MPASCPLCAHDSPALFYREHGYDISRCGDCGLLYVPNPPAPTTLQSMYDEESWVDSSGATVRRDADYDSKGHDSEARAKLKRLHTSSGRLLDVGCGTGDLVQAASEAGFTAEGVELSARRVATARSRGLTIHHGDLLELDLPDGTYDVVVCVDILSHVREPLPFLKRVAQLLRPDGELMLETGNKAELELPSDGMFLRDFWGAPGHLTFFGERQLRQALARTQFDVVKVDRFPMLDLMLDPDRLRAGDPTMPKRVLAAASPVRQGLKQFYRRKAAGRPESASLVVHATRIGQPAGSLV